MAWMARLTGPVTQSGRDVMIGVEYYDDGNPDAVLHSRGFSFPVNWSAGDMADAVRAEGVAARAAIARAAALTAQFPAASTVITIP